LDTALFSQLGNGLSLNDKVVGIQYMIVASVVLRVIESILIMIFYNLVMILLISGNIIDRVAKVGTIRLVMLSTRRLLLIKVYFLV
jgi:hypothetical protein